MTIFISEHVAAEVIDLVQHRLNYTAPEHHNERVRQELSELLEGEIRRVLRENKVCAHHWEIASTVGGRGSKLQAVLCCKVCGDERELEEGIPF